MIKKVVTYLNEVKAELKKVSWSTRDELWGATVLVFSTMFILGIFVGCCDFFLSRVIGLMIR